MARCLVVLAAVALLVPGASRAARLDVVVVDADGAPVRDAAVRLSPEVRGITSRLARTDIAGRAVLEDVPPGSYGLTVLSPPADNLVPIGAGYPPPSGDLTITAADERVPLRVVMARGGRVVLDARGEGGFRFPDRIGAVLREIFTGETRRAEIRQGVRNEVLVPPGRWTIAGEPPPGWLPRAVEVGRETRAGDAAEVEVQATQSPLYVTFVYAGEARIEGRVAGGSVLLAAARAAPDVPRVTTGMERDGTYGMVLPAGTWIVTPEHDRLEEALPPSVTLRLAPGETGRADFDVVLADGERRPTLAVQVVDPDGRPLRDAAALVEARPAGARDDAPPVERAHAPFGLARLQSLQPGDHDLRVCHPDYLCGSLTFRGFPEREPLVARVPLVAGAEVAVRALDAEGRPVGGVTVRLEACDGVPPREPTDDPEYLARRRGPRATDRTGRARFRGREPGCWRLSGSYGTGDFVRVRDGERDLRELELRLDGGAKRDVELRVLPAASVRFHTVCGGGEPLPVPFDWIAVEAFREAQKRVSGAARRDASGTAAAGPLEEGVFRVGVRPAGFDVFTWWPSTEDAAEAAALDLEPGKPHAPGTLVIDCAPRVQLVPAAGTPAYPPRAISFEATLAGSEKPLEVVPREDGALLIKGLPETTAPARLTVAVGYPLALREPFVTLEADAPALRRGARLELPYRVAASP